jgi:transposase
MEYDCKRQAYHPSTQYLILDRKRKIGLIKKMKKQITKFEITDYVLGLEVLNSSS